MTPLMAKVMIRIIRGMLANLWRKPPSSDWMPPNSFGGGCHPRDGTPGCTQEALDFGGYLEEVHRLGGEVVGVSTQSPESHRKFAEKYGLRHILLSDDGALGRALGILKESGTTQRSTFLLNPEGKVAKTWKNVKVRGHAEEVVEDLKRFRSK